MGNGVTSTATWLRKVLESSHFVRYDFENSLLKSTWGSLTRAIAGSALVAGVAGAILLLSVMAVTSPERVKPNDVALGPTSDESKVEYYLPYPGVLPDSMLYKVKAGRDWVKLAMTWNGEDKGRLELLYADKRINAAQILVDGNKVDLGIVTAVKAENYLQNASNRVIDLQDTKDEKSLLGDMRKAGLKHREILKQIGQRAGGAMNAGERVMLEKAIAQNAVVQQNIEQAIREAK